MATKVSSRGGGCKTKTGCVTCKARRIKCDERKPTCARCEKSQRLCQGYRAPLPRHRREGQLMIVSYVPTADGSLSAQPESDAREQRALAFFRHQTAPELSGVFSGHLWTRFMLLVAHHQSSVKHALVALSTLHERFVATDNMSRQTLTSDFALQHYSKAINQVIAMRDNKREDGGGGGGSSSAEVALVSCVLFFCLESLRGYYQSAVTHILSGIRIMQEHQSGFSSSGQGGGAIHAYIPHAIIRHVFLQMDSQVISILGGHIDVGDPFARETELSLPMCYASPEDAMADFLIIYNLAMHLFHRAEIAVRHGNVHLLEHLEQQRAQCEGHRARWQSAFQAMLLLLLLNDDDGGGGGDETGRCLHPRNPGCMVLNVQNHALRIILAVDLIDREKDFDQFTDIFRGMVDHVEEIVLQTSSPYNLHPACTTTNTNTAGTCTPTIAPCRAARTTPIFSPTLGIVSILYFSTANCRSRPIRYKALSLLKSCNRREGMWDSRIAADIAEQLVKVEEACSLPQRQYTTGSNAYDNNCNSIMPLRIKSVHVKFGPESSGVARYSFMNSLEAYRYDVQRNQRGSSSSSSSSSSFNQLVAWNDINNRTLVFPS